MYRTHVQVLGEGRQALLVQEEDRAERLLLAVQGDTAKLQQHAREAGVVQQAARRELQPQLGTHQQQSVGSELRESRCAQKNSIQLSCGISLRKLL